MSRFPVFAYVTVFASIVALSACNSLSPEARSERENNQKIARATIRAAHMNPPPQAFKDFALVRKYYAAQEANSGYSGIIVEVGPYQGGTAVLGERGMAFWVKDGKAYVVDEEAKAAAPELPQAPENIRFDGAFKRAAMK